MSLKAARGTKRVCQNCGSKFYDLNRDEIVCPICNTMYKHETLPSKAMLAGNSSDEDDDDDVLAATPSTVEMVPLEEADGDDGDIPDLEDNDLVEIEDDDEELSSDDESFIEVEDDDSGNDVSGIVSGPGKEDDDA